jgi:phage-related protein
MSNTLIFDSTSLSDFGLIIQKMEFPLSPSVQIFSDKLPYNGSVLMHGGFSSREFIIPVIIEGTSPSNLLSNVDSLNALFFQECTSTLSFDFFNSGRYWNVMYTGGLDKGKFLNDKTLETSITFKSASPFSYSVTDSTSSFSVTSSSYDFNINGVGGNYFSSPIFYIEASSTVLIPTIKNNDLIEEVSWANSLASGNYLRIDCEEWKCSKSTDGVTYSTYNQNVEGYFPQLRPGNNSFTISNCDSCDLTVIYRDTWI